METMEVQAIDREPTSESISVAVAPYVIYSHSSFYGDELAQSLVSSISQVDPADSLCQS